MVVGDPGIWADRFRSLDTRFLECVVALWPKCRKVLLDQPEEDTITINLVDVLLKDVNVRRIFYYIEYHYEPFGYTELGTGYSKGEIDLVVLLDQSRERYLAYECKRLNVSYDGKRHSLATKYVKDGVVRFVTEQYGEDLPVGCMLGYVLDGRVPEARLKVCAAIKVNKTLIGLVSEPVQQQPVGSVKRFSSRHNRVENGKEIEIRHAFLPF